MVKKCLTGNLQQQQTQTEYSSICIMFNHLRFKPLTSDIQIFTILPLLWTLFQDLVIRVCFNLQIHQRYILVTKNINIGPASMTFIHLIIRY